MADETKKKSRALTKVAKEGEVLHPVTGGKLRDTDIRRAVTQSFLEDFRKAWDKHGAKALEQMALKEPANFIRAACLLMPKDVLSIDARGGIVVVKLSQEDMAL